MISASLDVEISFSFSIDTSDGGARSPGSSDDADGTFVVLFRICFKLFVVCLKC